MNNTILYDWVFSYNPYTRKWRAAKRENYNELFSGGDTIISSSSIDTLIEIIIKTGGDISKADKLVENEENREFVNIYSDPSRGDGVSYY